MNIAILTSTKDPASMNIRENLLKLAEFTKVEDKYCYKNTTLYTLNTELIFAENIDKTISADLFIFASRHQSASKIPSLSVHSPGNFGNAVYGGKEKKLCVAPANYLKAAMIKLQKLASNTKYDIIQEVTHHGPLLDKPAMFIEIGSTEEEWAQQEAGEIIAKVILELCTENIQQYPSVLGIGGPHNCPGFKKIILGENFALGHICAKYNLTEINEELIGHAMQRTFPKADLVILEWKGLGEHKQKIIGLLEQIGVTYKRTSDF